MGEGPDQQNHEWFDRDKKKVSFIGFGIYYWNEETQTINCKNKDVVSDFEGMKSIDTIRLFKFVMGLKEFKAVQKPNFIIWMDCGTQFRSAEFTHFLFNELADLGICVNLNFFVKYIGKT